MIERIKDSNNIEQDVFKLPLSIYPLSNFIHYGVSNDVFKLFKLNSKVFTQHDDTIQLCFDDLCENDCDEIIAFIKVNCIRMVSGPTNCLEKLFKLLPGAILKTGYIFEFNSFECDKNHVIEKATKKTEFERISELVCNANSSNKSYYTVDQYFHQIYDRYVDKYCRNWICSLDGLIIGHIATYAETKDFAVVGGLAVDNNYRGRGIAKVLLSKAIDELKKEHKKVYAFCYEKNLYAFYSSISVAKYQYSKLLF